MINNIDLKVQLIYLNIQSYSIWVACVSYRMTLSINFPFPDQGFQKCDVNL